MRKVFLGLLVLASGALAGWMIVLDRQSRLLWDHWDVVKPGILYRSGQLTAGQLTEAVRSKGIRTVVSFQLPGKEMNAERELARSLGVGFVNLPMPGDGFGEEAQFRKVLEIVDDPQRRPVLIHCARGTCDGIRRGSLSVRARWLDDPRRGGGVAAAELSGRIHSGLYLCDGQDQTVADPAQPGQH